MGPSHFLHSYQDREGSRVMWVSDDAREQSMWLSRHETVKNCDGLQPYWSHVSWETFMLNAESWRLIGYRVRTVIMYASVVMAYLWSLQVCTGWLVEMYDIVSNNTLLPQKATMDVVSVTWLFLLLRPPSIVRGKTVKYIVMSMYVCLSVGMRLSLVAHRQT